MKRELTEEERQECARLKALYLQWKASTGRTQEQAAEALGFKTQGAVSQYLNGRLALNLEACVKFAAMLGCQVEEISPRLAAIWNVRPDMLQRHVAKSMPLRVSLEPLEVWDDETPLDEDTVEIVLYRTVEIQSGPGRAPQHEIDDGARLRYGLRTLKKAGVDPANAAGGINRGNSNEPVIPDGSVVLLDLSKRQIIDGELYGIDHDGEFRAKLLYRLPGGGLRLRSYNREEYPDEDYGPDWPQRINILGWVWLHQPPVRKWRGQ